MWDKRRDMIVRTESPFNAEPPTDVLAEGEIDRWHVIHCGR